MKRWTTFLFLLFYAVLVHGQLVQTKTGNGTIALDANVTKDHALLVITHFAEPATRNNCTAYDTLGTSFSIIQTVTGDIDTWIGFAPSTGVDTIKVHSSVADPDVFCQAQVYEIANITLASPVDVASSVAGCVCGSQTTSLTTTLANDFVVAWGQTETLGTMTNASGGWGYLGGTGLGPVSNVANSWYRLGGAAGVYSATITQASGFLGEFYVGMIALKMSPPPPPSSTVTVMGTINYADGTGFNGQLELTTTKSTVINKCTSPVQIVPTTATLKVVNGVVALDNNKVYATNCLQPTLPYLAKLRCLGVGCGANNNVVLFTDNWYLPQTESGNVDVGQLIATNYAAGVTVSLPYAIISSPAGSQTITQPPGTTLTVNNLVVLNPISGSVTSLAGTPALCSGGQLARGIANNGDAICTTIGSGVVSFNGRAGTVVPVSGDYSYSMLSGLPMLLNQNLYNNSVAIGTPRPGMDFSARFSLFDEGSPAATGVDLATVISGGAFINVIGLTVDNWGRVISVSSSGSSNPCGVLNGINCEYNASSGIIHEWGTTSSFGAGVISVSFPVTFPSTCFTVDATTLSGTDRITYVTSVSTSGFSVGNNGSGAQAMWNAWGK